VGSFFDGDLNDTKKMKRLNKAHIEAMAILKNIERKSIERNYFELKEADSYMNNC
jgi:hypothetical protein